MTVGELKKALAGVPDDFPLVRVSDWHGIRAARPDSYLRGLPANVFLLIGEDDYDIYDGKPCTDPRFWKNIQRHICVYCVTDRHELCDGTTETRLKSTCDCTCQKAKP